MVGLDNGYRYRYAVRMADESLRTYARNDVSVRTSLRVCGDRVARPWGTLVHSSSGTNSLAWLQGGSVDEGARASADALIAREGTQYLITPEGKYAYHAGNSLWTFDREYRGNQVSMALLGVELECLDAQTPTFEQLDSLADLIVYWASVWGWRWPLIILGHYAVARPLGRRLDPVNMDWGWLMGRLFVRAVSVGLPGL